MVLDASMALSWLMERVSRPEQARSEKALIALAHGPAQVPAIWFAEVANACLTAERRRIATAAHTTDFLARLDALPIVVDPHPVRPLRDAILGIGRTYKLSACDATYLELAMRTGSPLASFDGALIQAAAAAGVTVL
jgi:predicted nucleic acid-binding protein